MEKKERDVRGRRYSLDGTRRLRWYVLVYQFRALRRFRAEMNASTSIAHTNDQRVIETHLSSICDDILHVVLSVYHSGRIRAFGRKFRELGHHERERLRIDNVPIISTKLVGKQLVRGNELTNGTG